MQNANLLMLLRTRAGKSATSREAGGSEREHQVNDIQWACGSIRAPRAFTFTDCYMADKEIETFHCMMGSGSVRSASLYASQEETALIILLDSFPQASFSQNSTSWNKQLSISTRWRLYESLTEPIKAKTTALHIPHILVCVSMTPALQNEDDFNKWYNEEHISLLSRNPMWLESTRYRLIDSNDASPSYLAMHKYENHSALDAPEFKLATTTPWRYQVVDAVVANQRHVYDYNPKFPPHPITNTSMPTKGDPSAVLDAKL